MYTAFGLEFPKIRGSLLVVPLIRILASWGSPVFGKLPYLTSRLETLNPVSVDGFSVQGSPVACLAVHGIQV